MKKMFAAVLLVFAGSIASAADLEVSAAWVRATVPQQKASGAFMQLRSKRDCKLIAASSPVAGKTEIHEMRLENEVMKMSPIDALDLPAGEVLELKPGGYHLMLLDLGQRLQVGEQIPLSLVVQCDDESPQNIELTAEVLPLAGGAGTMPHGHGHEH